jgi:thiamine monophosphate synthase
MGLELFAEISGALNIPALALGGINLLNFHEPLRRGAAGIAAIGLFNDLGRLEQNIQTILSASPTR